MPHSAVSQNNYQVKFISLHMNLLISLVHYFNNPVIGSLTPIILTSLAAILSWLACILINTNWIIFLKLGIILSVQTVL